MKTTSLPVLLLLAACGGSPVFHHGEDFGGDRQRRHEFAAAPETVCEAARRVLIGQGYVVARADEAREVVLVAQKDFREKDKRHAVVQMQVVCSPRGAGTQALAAGVESHFDVAQVESKAGVALPLVAPLSLTVARSNREQIKLAGESIDDRGFYEAFFKAVARELGAR